MYGALPVLPLIIVLISSSVDELKVSLTILLGSPNFPNIHHSRGANDKQDRRYNSSARTFQQLASVERFASHSTGPARIVASKWPIHPCFVSMCVV